MTPNELVLTFGGLHVCVQFGENRRRNATVRVSTDGQTHTRTHGQTQNDFIICPMLYAIAMGQIIRKLTIFLFCNIVPNNYAELSSECNLIVLAASSGKRHVSIWCPSVRLYVPSFL